MAKVHNILEMWQGSQHLRAMQRESHAHNKQRTAIGFILDTEEIVNASWTNYQHNGAAAFQLSGKSLQPPALSAKDLLGVQSEIFNLRRIKKIDQHPVGSDEDRAPESISNDENWLHWNVDMGNPNESEHDSKADDKSDLQPVLSPDAETHPKLIPKAKPVEPIIIYPCLKHR